MGPYDYFSLVGQRQKWRRVLMTPSELCLLSGAVTQQCESPHHYSELTCGGCVAKQEINLHPITSQ